MDSIKVFLTDVFSFLFYGIVSWDNGHDTIPTTTVNMIQAKINSNNTI